MSHFYLTNPKAICLIKLTSIKIQGNFVCYLSLYHNFISSIFFHLFHTFLNQHSPYSISSILLIHCKHCNVALRFCCLSENRPFWKSRIVWISSCVLLIFVKFAHNCSDKLVFIKHIESQLRPIQHKISIS